MISLTGKAALITGGSRGIGAACVRMFAQAGADVVFSFHRDQDSAERVAQEARRHSTRVEFFKADLARMGPAEKLVKFAHQSLGRLDILVSNAGIWNVDDLPIEKMSERDWDHMMAVNLKSVYSAIHFSVPHMIQQKSGRIIAISSTAGQRGEAFHSHYGATKGAVISLVKGLSTELAAHNILVNSVAPGWVDTDMSKPVFRNKKVLKQILEKQPLHRVATAEECAGPVLFLASELSSFITGEILNVNGGSVLCG